VDIHGRPLARFSLIASVALLAASCSSTEQLLRDEHDREVASLQQQLEEQDHRLDDLRSEVSRLSRTVYKLTEGQLVTIPIGENPSNVDIQSIINRMPFRFAIYDDDGYKGEVTIIK
jgi:septal ring factor EnvC (AmiA/AmiB activator)